MKNLLNRENMTNATFKRILRYADANNIYELIALAKAEGARLGRKEEDKKVNATQYYIDKYNNEIMAERERIKEEQMNIKKLEKEQIKKNKEEMKRIGKELNEQNKKGKKFLEDAKKNAKLYIKQNDKNFNDFFQGKINSFEVDLSKMTYTTDETSITDLFKNNILDKVPNQQDAKNFIVL